MKRFFVFALLVIGGLVGCDDSGSKVTKSLTPPPKIKTVTGEVIDFSHLKRQWVMVNYWANWCESCKKEIPELNAFADSHGNDVYLIGVNYDGVGNKQLLELIAKNEIHYFNAQTDPAQVLSIGDIPGLPVTFVFDKTGKLKTRLYGPQTEESLNKAIK